MRISQQKANEMATKIADRLLFMSGVNVPAQELIPARHEGKNTQLAGGYNRNDLVEVITSVIQND